MENKTESITLTKALFYFIIIGLVVCITLYGHEIIITSSLKKLHYKKKIATNHEIIYKTVHKQ